MKNISHLKFIISLFLFCFILLSISCKLQEIVTNKSFENEKANVINENDLILKGNREIWMKSSICSYKMTLEASNLSPTKFSSPVDLEIQDGNILNVELVSPKNEKLTNEQKTFIKDQYKNSVAIEKLFEFAVFAAEEKRNLTEKGRSNSVRFEISYDPQYGYPKKIHYSRSDVTDTLNIFEVKKFEVLKSQNPCN